MLVGNAGGRGAIVVLMLRGRGGADGAAGVGEGIVGFVCGAGADISHGGLYIIEDAQEGIWW